MANYRELFDAIGRNDVHTLRHSLQCGVDPNWHESSMGITPLYSAVAGDRVDAARVLLEYGADPNLRINYRSPVDKRVDRDVVALMFARSKEMVDQLISNGADVNAIDSDGATALIRAASSGKYEVVIALLAAGANTSNETNTGHSALDAANAQISRLRDWIVRFPSNGTSAKIEALEQIVFVLQQTDANTKSTESREG